MKKNCKNTSRPRPWAFIYRVHQKNLGLLWSARTLKETTVCYLRSVMMGWLAAFRSRNKYPIVITVRARTNRFKNSFISYAIANYQKTLAVFHVFLCISFMCLRVHVDLFQPLAARNNKRCCQRKQTLCTNWKYVECYRNRCRTQSVNCFSLIEANSRCPIFSRFNARVLLGHVSKD